MNKELEKIYTIQEVAEYFKVSKQTIHNWLYLKKLSAIKTPGGELRIKESELKKFLGKE